MDYDGSIPGSSRAIICNAYKTVIVYYTYLIFLLVNKFFIIKLFILMFFYIQRFYTNKFFLQIYTYIYIFTVVKCIVVYGFCAMPKKNTKLTPRESVYVDFMPLIIIFVFNLCLLIVIIGGTGEQVLFYFCCRPNCCIDCTTKN